MLLVPAGTCPRGADAGIDMTGAWYLLIVGQTKTLVHFVQRGTSVRVEEEGAVPAACRAGGGGAAADYDGGVLGRHVLNPHQSGTARRGSSRPRSDVAGDRGRLGHTKGHGGLTMAESHMTRECRSMSNVARRCQLRVVSTEPWLICESGGLRFVLPEARAVALRPRMR
jgi:hypothetical protein